MKETKTILVLEDAIKLHEFSFLEDIYKFKLTSFYLGAMKDDDYIIYNQIEWKLQVSMWLHHNLILSCCIIKKRLFRKKIVINLREESEKISNGKIKPSDFKGFLQNEKFHERFNELNPPRIVSSVPIEILQVEDKYFIDFEENKARDTYLYVELLKMYLNNIEK